MEERGDDEEGDPGGGEGRLSAGDNQEHAKERAGKPRDLTPPEPGQTDVISEEASPLRGSKEHDGVRDRDFDGQKHILPESDVFVFNRKGGIVSRLCEGQWKLDEPIICADVARPACQDFRGGGLIDDRVPLRNRESVELQAHEDDERDPEDPERGNRSRFFGGPLSILPRNSWPKESAVWGISRQISAGLRGRAPRMLDSYPLRPCRAVQKSIRRSADTFFMTTPILRGPSLFALCLILVSFLTSGEGFAESRIPLEVVHSVAIHNGDWTPLSVEDMKRASVDTALARLSDAGRLRIMEVDVEAPEDDSRGELDVSIHLIGLAEAAKVTMTLDFPGSPTLVATAAISIRALDYRGIYEAFEFVGEQTADRLAAKLDHLSSARFDPDGVASRAKADPKRRQAFSAAQLAKRAGRYAEARMGFEAVVASSADPEDGLRSLAEDELRYGLPVYEAQQATNRFSRPGHPNQTAERNTALSRAENLYRQIEAENPDVFDRIAEAQQAIDGVLVMREAMANALRANLMSRFASLRMKIAEYSMIEGRCPPESFVREVLSRRSAGLTLETAAGEASGKRRYRIAEDASRNRIDLVCGPEGVEMAEAIGDLGDSPASTR